ncbi:MAG: 2-octaprenyl-6-methoxyphenyl hydroxylase [Gammaproteobacteria bacterium]|jgi:2-octaprenyl-6-methoxyphenol hydroxylase|nr:2-octaprenyl-6-methoxyphenyl hydroxylase [Gammaproteobacteria bacterium]
MSAGSEYDIAIVGGGMVGASLACMLSGGRWRIAVVEAADATAGNTPAYEDRAIALSLSSRNILSAIGLWDGLAGSAAPVRTIHVSERGRFGATRFRHEEEGVEALGYVATARDIGMLLHRELANRSDVSFLAPRRVVELHLTDDLARLRCEDNDVKEPRDLTARLVVAADGTESSIRKRLGIEVDIEDYGQTAVVTNVTPGVPHDFTAFERFTPSGPMALLPLDADRMSLVWTHRNDRVGEVLAWDDDTFLDRLQSSFGYRLGKFRKAGSRSAYPLRLVRARHQVEGRIALLGNAAHSLHPVGAQGFNLALREIALLAEMLVDEVTLDGDPGDPAFLRRFERRFRSDLARTTRFTDTLARVFVNPWSLLKPLRSLGLVTLDAVPPLRHRFARVGMGIQLPLPRLAAGIPLRNGQ